MTWLYIFPPCTDLQIMRQTGKHRNLIFQGHQTPIFSLKENTFNACLRLLQLPLCASHGPCLMETFRKPTRFYTYIHKDTRLTFSGCHDNKKSASLSRIVPHASSSVSARPIKESCTPIITITRVPQLRYPHIAVPAPDCYSNFFYI